MKDLRDKKVAILATNGFEERELEEPLNALTGAGAEVEIVSDKAGVITSWKDRNWHKDFQVDKLLGEIDATDYDALVIPGGVYNPDQLRRNPAAVTFVRKFVQSGKPVAAICHGPWMLAEAGVLKGRKITSFDSIKTDMQNAGADWVDREVVVDNGLVTSRSPEDLKAFNAKLLEEIREGKHTIRQRESAQS